MAKIIYTGIFRFPDKGAAAARVLGIGKALRAAGHEIEFAGWEDQGRQEDLKPEGYYYQQFRYVPQRDLPTEPAALIKRAMRFIQYGKNTLQWLEAQELKKIHTVIAYGGGGTWFLTKLKALCSSKGVKLIIDSAEWYDPCNVPGGRFGLPYWDSEFRMRYINVSIGRLIVISSYLERYYLGKGCKVLRVPPLVDLDEARWRNPPLHRIVSDGTLRIGYAGTPGKKDLLGNVLLGLWALRKVGVPLELHLIGPALEEVTACLGADASILNEIKNSLILHGKVPQALVPHLLAKMDFTVLLRPCERYAEAGFPTKLVESLAAGVPVIANPTSDIAEFVRDGKEGILLADHLPETFAAGVKRAFAMSREQMEFMRCSAKSCAELFFNFKNYSKQLGNFII